jgi:hypothetical protein
MSHLCGPAEAGPFRVLPHDAICTAHFLTRNNNLMTRPSAGVTQVIVFDFGIQIELKDRPILQDWRWSLRSYPENMTTYHG